MKIRIPTTVAVVANLATGELAKDAYTFSRHFLCNGLLLDPAWAKSLAGIYTAMELRGIFRDAKEGELVEVTLDQQRALRERLESPEAPFTMALAVQLKTYFDAILCPEVDK